MGIVRDWDKIQCDNWVEICGILGKGQALLKPPNSLYKHSGQVTRGRSVKLLGSRGPFTEEYRQGPLP